MQRTCVLHIQRTLHMQRTSALHMQRTCVAYAAYVAYAIHFLQKNDFFQKVPDEIFFNDWFLIPACEDYTKLKKNLQ